jgi:hypothetical protein
VFFLEKTSSIPKLLGIQSNKFIKRLVIKLEGSIDQDYYEKIKYRSLQKYPDMNERKFEVLYFELKRFFLLKALVPNLSMYSPKVDDIWHEMLMFTREYQEFSHRFLGEMIHHNPHLRGKVDHSGRAWFDWLYLHVYNLESFSWNAWNGFLFSTITMENLNGDSEEEIIKNIFNVNRFEKDSESYVFFSGMIQKLR